MTVVGFNAFLYLDVLGMSWVSSSNNWLWAPSFPDTYKGLISTGNGLFTCSLLPVYPSEDVKASFSQISAGAYLKPKSSPEIEGICQGCGSAAQMHWLSTASGVWRSDRSHPRDTGPVQHRWGAPRWPAAGGGLGAQLLLPPSLPPPDWKLCPCCSLGFPVIQAVEGSSPLTSRSEQPLQMVARLGVVNLCYGGIPPPFSPQRLSWLWLTSIGI